MIKMKSLDRYLDFLVNYKRDSLLDEIKRFFSYIRFKRTTINELLDEYTSLYDMLMDFHYLYLKLDLFYNLSSIKEYNDLIQIEVKRSRIISEAYILNDYTNFYTIKFKNLEDSSNMIEYEWDDRERQVDYKPRPGATFSLDDHSSKSYIETAASYILNTLDYVLDKNWRVPNKNLNFLSIKIESIELIDLHIFKSSIQEDYQIKIDLETKCQYINLGKNRFIEIVPMKANITYNETVYNINLKLFITYINYRKDYLKDTYNPYIVNFIESNRSIIYDYLESSIKFIIKPINLLSKS